MIAPDLRRIRSRHKRPRGIHKVHYASLIQVLAMLALYLAHLHLSGTENAVKEWVRSVAKAIAH